MIFNPKNYLHTRWGFGNQVVHAQREGMGGDALGNLGVFFITY